METWFGLLALAFFIVWIGTVINVAASRRCEGVEKALWVLISLMFPIIGGLAFAIARPAPKRTLGDIAAGR